DDARRGPDRLGDVRDGQVDARGLAGAARPAGAAPQPGEAGRPARVPGHGVRAAEGVRQLRAVHPGDGRPAGAQGPGAVAGERRLTPGRGRGMLGPVATGQPALFISLTGVVMHTRMCRWLVPAWLALAGAGCGQRLNFDEQKVVSAREPWIPTI